MIVPGIISLSSILLYTYLPDLLTMAISSQMVLKDDDSILLNMWTKPPIGVDYEFNFFDVMNPSAVLRGEKPRVRTVGPFCFKQWRTKKIMAWSENGEMVKYVEYKNHLFAPEGEGCKPNMDEMVTVINPPIAALGAVIADMVREKVPLTAVTSPIIMSAMSAFLVAHQQNMFMKRSVKEILLGFRINLMDTVVAMLRPLEMLGYRKEDLLPGGGIPNNTFGLLYGKNNTPEGPYEVYTGKNPHYRFVHLGKYKNMGTLPFWKSQYCNQIRGSDGTMFGAGVKRDTKLWAFAADLCRSLYLSYVRDSEYRGIPTFRYGIDETLFGSAAVEPKNECFCVHPPKQKHRCEISGILDIGGCQGGAPLIVSKVQFLSTSPDLSLGVDGFEPNKDEHDSFVELEPMTGLPLNGVKKLQFALRVEKVPFLRGFSNMRNVSYIPFAFATEKGALPDDWADMMRNFFITPLKVIYWALLGTAGGAGFLAGRSGLRRLMASRQARQSVKQIRNSAKNLYKKRNAVDSEISSTKSKNSITELIPKSSYQNDENYANTTNVKLRLKNGNHEQPAAASRLQQLSASRLNPFYLNGQSLMQSYFPQVIPIIMPFPYTMQNNENGNRTEANDRTPTSRPNNVNHAPMITSLSSFTTPATDRTSNGAPYNPAPFMVQQANRRPLDSRSSSVYPNIYPTIYPNIAALNRNGTSVVRRKSLQAEASNRTNGGRMKTIESRIESVDVPESPIRYDTPPNAAQPIKIESVAENRAVTNLEVESEVARIRSHLSSASENVNQFEYNNTDDHFYYFEPAQQAPTSQTALNATNNRTTTNLNDEPKHDHDAGFDTDSEADRAASNNQAYDQHSEHHLDTMSIDQLQLKAGHDQKKNSMDEFNATYEDFRKIKKIGYDYNYYE